MAPTIIRREDRSVADLTKELNEAREQQAATAEILKVIASSPSDVQPVFDAIVSSAARLFEPCAATITMLKDGKLHWSATEALLPGYDIERAKTIYPIAFDPARSPSARAMLERRIIEIPDTAAPDTPEYTRKAAAAGGFRAITFVPLIEQNQGIGTIIFAHPEPGFKFSDKQLAMVQTFADQAVIAIGNVRLFDEVQVRTRDLEESLQQQTATSEVLQIISSSPGDLTPVFEKMLENATRVCGAEFGSMVLIEGGDTMRSAALYNAPPEFAAARVNWTFRIYPQSSIGRAVREKTVIQTEDLRQSESYLAGNPSSVELAELGGARTIVVVPMLRDDEVIGAITVYRQEVRLFGDKQIDLLRNFARQAVIAIENARLFRELRQRTDELTEALIYQTGSSNILKVIASSPTDVGPALQAVVDSACEICDAYDAAVLLKEGDYLQFSAHHGPIPRGFEKWPINRNWVSGRAVVDKVTQHVHDLLGPEGDDLPETREIARREGHRTVLSVPLMREGNAVGAIALRRLEVQPFNEKQIELLKSFADQAVIAISNVRLFEQVQQRTRELSESLDDLRTAQDRLIQTEKLASLGQLTAGIAHEIKNPLNFVNNFSALSVELTDELKDVLKQENLTDQGRNELNELTGLLQDNLGKVVQHGKRADSIVKNMLLHSREGAGERRSAEINGLVEESLSLAYHGARAEKAGFFITLEHDLDPEAGALDLYPQEMTRALLNLISNGFYAATKRKAEAADGGFEPVLSAATRNLGKTIEIRIRDNGAGIPPEIREKMFNPFFTTKPTGEGTGLGLSMTYDIIVKQHGGRIDVETEPGVFTEFIITLPRKAQAVS
ncbi:MAG: GAF domain-containing protein [Bradyrhizobium sp.]|nr:GAF domain-containing protein [Bradyrhizobium sp.]